MYKIEFKAKDEKSKQNTENNINPDPKMPLGAVKLPMAMLPPKQSGTSAEGRLK